MALFKKKEYVVEAMRFIGNLDELIEVAKWCNGYLEVKPVEDKVSAKLLAPSKVSGMNAHIPIHVGSWVIRKADDEYTWLFHDDFENKYEEVLDTD